MPRPQKKRYVCALPENIGFVPLGKCAKEEIILSVDEYECIRLIDLEGYTQEECAGQMHISRTTVQGIYDAARKKTAEAIVMGKKLTIGGGDYVTCGCYSKKMCGLGCCHRQKCRQKENEE